MKFPLVIVSALLLFSCSPDGNDDSISALNSKEGLQPDSAKQRLLKIIEGGWVNEEYISAFSRLHSPMGAAAFGLPQQQMAFDISNLTGDTLLNAFGRLNYIEGERFDVLFYRRADGKTGMKLAEDRNNVIDGMLLNYTIESSDTILLLNFVKGKVSHTARFRRQFRKFPNDDDVSVTAMEYFVNKNLFAGNWEMSGKSISFSAEGRVNNFKAYKRYSVSTIADNTTSRPDKISFYNDSAGVTYAFTYEADKIQLFEVSESEDGMQISRGKLVGEMIHE